MELHHGDRERRFRRFPAVVHHEDQDGLFVLFAAGWLHSSHLNWLELSQLALRQKV